MLPVRKESVLAFASIIAFIYIIILLLFHSFGIDALQAAIYTPFYSLFGSFMYFPFILYLGKWAMLILAVAILLLPVGNKMATPKSKAGDKTGLVIMVMVLVAVLLVFSRRINYDIKSIMNDEFGYATVSLNDVNRKRVGGNRGKHVVYEINDYTLDAYQYNKLKSLKEKLEADNIPQNADEYIEEWIQKTYLDTLPPMQKAQMQEAWKNSDSKTRQGVAEILSKKEHWVKIYYLPHSQRVLKYELVE